MPELPEVETVKHTLAPKITGRRIERAEIGDYAPVVAHPGVDEFAACVAGRRIVDVGRRGKLLLLRFDNNDTVTVHLRMTGELSLVPIGTPRGRHFRLGLLLDTDEELRFDDVRKFGRWSLFTPDEYAAFDRSLGPEPLDPELTGQRFHDMLRGRKRAVKALLLEQSFLVGVGNIYADEALFRARLNPHRPAMDMTLVEAGRLLEAIRETLEGAILYRGTTLRNYRDGSGEPGGNLVNLQIYSLAAGDPCPECGTPIARSVIGQRGARYCPSCQPL
jgi:formamidopyrimidine-DNA glycosylase